MLDDEILTLVASVTFFFQSCATNGFCFGTEGALL
jgi:hypothetical protein